MAIGGWRYSYNLVVVLGSSTLLLPLGCSEESRSAGGGGSAGMRSANGGFSATTGGSGSGAAASGGGTSTGAAPTAGGNGSVMASLDGCASFTAGLDTKVCTATYLSGAGNDEIGGVAVGPQGVIYGGALGAGVTATVSFLAGGSSGVALLDAAGKSRIASAALGQQVNDVAVAQNGEVFAAGDFGVAKLSPSLDALLWSQTLPAAGVRLALGADGSVAVSSGTTVRLYDSAGAPIGQVQVAQNRETPAIALDTERKQLIAAGYNQRDGGGCSELQVPFLRSYEYDGTLRWVDYDVTHAQAAAVNECADSRGYAVAIGLDGKLYYAGESHGGNSIHRRMPKDLSKMAPLEKPDGYQDGYNINAAAPLGFVGRFDLATGELETGSTFVVRLSSGKGNAFRPRAVNATKSGNILLSGASACCIPEATSRTVNGVPAMPEGSYAGGGFLLMLSPDFRSRQLWTTFNGATGGGATGHRVALGPRSAAVLFQQLGDQGASLTAESALLTYAPLQAAPGGGSSDSFLVVLRTPE